MWFVGYCYLFKVIHWMYDPPCFFLYWFMVLYSATWFMFLHVHGGSCFNMPVVAHVHVSFIFSCSWRFRVFLIVVMAFPCAWWFMFLPCSCWFIRFSCLYLFLICTCCKSYPCVFLPYWYFSHVHGGSCCLWPWWFIILHVGCWLFLHVHSGSWF